MRCQQKSCDKKAVWVVYWPGQTLCLCEDDMRWAKRIAECMGFFLPTRLVDEIEQPSGSPSFWSSQERKAR
jgi:hypothetical protein